MSSSMPGDSIIESRDHYSNGYRTLSPSEGCRGRYIISGSLFIIQVFLREPSWVLLSSLLLSMNCHKKFIQDPTRWRLFDVPFYNKHTRLRQAPRSRLTSGPTNCRWSLTQPNAIQWWSTSAAISSIPTTNTNTNLEENDEVSDHP